MEKEQFPHHGHRGAVSAHELAVQLLHDVRGRAIGVPPPVKQDQVWRPDAGVLASQQGRVGNHRDL